MRQPALIWRTSDLENNRWIARHFCSRAAMADELLQESSDD